MKCLRRSNRAQMMETTGTNGNIENGTGTESIKKDTGPSMRKTFGLVALLTVLSKFAGLARDIVLTAAYGTSVIADAYNYAYLFTGNILILFGGLGGPFHSSTVSILTPKKDDPNCGLLVTQLLVRTLLVLIGCTIIVYLVAPSLVNMMPYVPEVHSSALSAGGRVAMQATNDLRLTANQSLFHHQVIEQLNIMLPLIVISGVVGVSYGVLNVYNKIFWPSLSPAIASIAIIAAIGLSDPRYRLITGVPLAVGTLAGAVGQMIAQLPGIQKLNLNWKLTRTPQPGLKEYTGMLWPAVFSTSVGQLNVYVDSFFTLMVQTQGAWTAIVQSNRVVQLPLGILLTAMLVPILPRFTQQAAENRLDDLKEELRRALRFLWFLSLPMTIIMLVIPKPIVDVLFRRGNFDENSSMIVTAALLWLTPMIVFYVARDLMTRVFYAFQDSMTPYKVAMLAIVIKAPLDWFFVTLFRSVEAISLATTIMTIINLSLLTFLLRRKVGNLGFSKLVKPMLIMLAGTAVCGILTYSLYNAIAGLIHATGTWTKLFALSISSASGMICYLIVCIGFRLDEPMMLARRLPIVRNWVPKSEK